MSTEERLKFYYDRSAEVYKLGCISALLGWDQRVYMPTQAAEARASQLEYLSLQMHARITDPKLLDTVDELYVSLRELSPADQVNIRESKRILDIQRKLPEDFVAEESKMEAITYSAWVIARPADDFEAVKPLLEKIVGLQRRKADLIGYKGHPYDALLDLYEPGATTAEVKPLLENLGEALRELIPPICERFCDGSELEGHFPATAQEKLCARTAKALSFSFDSGRIDTTPHPFMTTLGPRDFRITTRYNESNFLSALYGIIHETGHALYELGLPIKYVGTPMGEAVSLGIHESQSRFWENLVGRSREFCSYICGVVNESFADAALTPDSLWMYANRVHPSLIRVEADEVTYSQHIVIRMLLEISLMTGDLSVADLPDAWNDLYEKYLGVRPTDYKDGVMQDVHWYSGSIGYFPTYALGNLYGAMMLETAKTQLPDLSHQVETGQFTDLLAWLRENVHRHGMTYKGPELIRRITGKDLNAGPFVEYVKGKFLSGG